MGSTQHTADELIAILRLQHVPNIGDVLAKKLISHCGSAIAIFGDKQRSLLKIDGIGTHSLRHLYEKEHLEAAEAEYQYIQKNNIALTYFQDASYPHYLKHCIDGPILIISKGEY